MQELAQSGDWGRYHGPWHGQLRDRLREVHQTAHVHLCCSGTVAVELALRGLRIGPGDEVLLAAYDFKANLTNVLHVGARPVLVDVRPDDWQLDVALLEAAWRPEVRAVIASHLQGGTVEMPALRDWADRRGVAIIEDACQAAGATVHGRPAGGWGDLAVLSFGGSKLVTSGRGGAVLTSRADIAQRMRLVAERGNDAYPLSELQAALLLPQLERLAAAHAQRAASVSRLKELLTAAGLQSLSRPQPESSPAYYKLGWQYAAERFAGLSRDRFAAALRAEGIAVDPGFRALHRTHAASRFRAGGSLVHADAADAACLTLHHPVLLGTESDLAQIAIAVGRLQRHAGEVVAANVAAARPSEPRD